MSELKRYDPYYNSNVEEGYEGMEEILLGDYYLCSDVDKRIAELKGLLKDALWDYTDNANVPNVSKKEREFCLARVDRIRKALEAVK